MHHALSLDELQHLTRSRVCDTCPYRTAGTHGRPIDQSKPCEAVCPLFQRLPVLRQAARQIDVKAGSPPQALHRVLERIAGRASSRGNIVKRHEPTVIAMLHETFT
jgi:hypothetical protein